MAFKKEDVLKVASAVIEQAPYFEHAGSSYSGFDGYSCSYCEARKEEIWENVKHDLDCVTLVARDLLT